MIIYPAIDLKDGRCVRLTQGQASRETVYGADPVEMAQRWRDEGAEYLHMVDLDGAFDGEPRHLGVIAQVVNETGLKVQVGGGIRTRDTVLRYLNAGVRRVIIGTRALESPEWLASLCDEFPNQIAAGVDARDGKVAVRGWVEVSDMTALDLADRLKPMNLSAAIFTDISKDGMLQGPAIDSTRAFAERIARPVVASGGVGNIEHVRALAKLPIEGIIIGKALYTGAVQLKDALEAVAGV